LLKSVVVVCSLGLMAGWSVAAPGGQSIKASYVVLGPSGSQTARAIVPAGMPCPLIQIDGTAAQMQLRAAPTLPTFPVSVCELAVPLGASKAQVAGRPLPLLSVEQPKRIAALGDTGCRMKTGHAFQACDDPASWPFAAVSRAVAEWRPELVINTGDYLYRELACTPGDKNCAASPVGDNWETWERDFFAPAAPLLAAAPWIVGRGDHEMCSRGGGGFFRFLDPRPWSLTCQEFTEPYVVQSGDLRFVMMDSSAAASTTPEKVALYSEQFIKAKALQSGQTWLVTHMPIWAFRSSGKGEGQQLIEMTPALSVAAQSGLTGFSLVMSSHIHLFQLLSFSDRRPLQLVVGTGGTALDQEINRQLPGASISSTSVLNGFSTSSFGFTGFEREKDQRDWRITFYDINKKNTMSCKTAGANFQCNSGR
jgi:hypothetical protein